MFKSIKTLLVLLFLITYLAGSSGAQSQLAGDFDGNFSVDLMDLRIFALQWLHPGCLAPGCIADIDSANGVNMVDFSLLAQNWQIIKPHLVINELMASNIYTLMDKDGSSSDWIEIYNPTEKTINLDGWSLTDNDSDLTMWQFPDSLEIRPGEFLIIFASGKNISDPNELHTNFELNKEGDYLALVADEGNTVIHQYTPEFPQQLTDISYGLTQDAKTLVPTGATASFHVPTSGDSVLGTGWTEINFDDSSWFTGPTALGFGSVAATDVRGVMQNVNASLWTRIEFFLQEGDFGSFDMLLLRMKYEDGFVAYLNGVEVASCNAPGSVQWNSTADSDRPIEESEVFKSINIMSHSDLLQPSPQKNVLAIQGLNDAKNNGEFLILPELIAAKYQKVPQYFTTPTPGTFNIPGAIDVVGDVWFGYESGFYNNPLQLSLYNGTKGSVIRFTSDGSLPTITHGYTYTSPINIGSNMMIRAVAVKPGWLDSAVQTHAYMFIEPDVQGFSSNLPIGVVDTFGRGIGENTHVLAFASFIDTAIDGRARITDVPNFMGRGGINIRGKSSAGFPKKQYHLEIWDEHDLDKEVSILGFPPESDWVLQGPYSDKALMRNFLSYKWSNDIGRYAVRSRFIELFLNTNGGSVSMNDYVGVYVFMERIKRNKDRVDITRLEPRDDTEPDITGGYIIKKDKFDPGEPSFYTSTGQHLIYVEPKGTELTQLQKDWIKGYLDQFESVLYGPNFTDPVDGYAKYIDPDSFVDHHIIVELTKNIDGFRLSTYMYKDRGGRLNMGPVWDYNLSLGNADYLQGWLSEGWYYSQLNNTDYPWWRRLFEDPEFRLRYADRWFGHRRELLSTARLRQDIDDTALLLNEAQVRNFNRWPVLGIYIWPNWFIAQTYQEEINWMKGWLSNRLTWMDSQIAFELAPPGPTFSQQGGQVDHNFNLTMSAPSGKIYYTLDGKDPRLSESLQTETTTLVVEDVPKKVFVPSGPVNDNWKGGGAFDDSGWNHGNYITGKTGGAGYDETPDYLPYISYDVGALMNGDVNSNNNNSCYMRFPFTFNGDPCQFNFMTLNIRYDDGFIAYLNGDEIERINFPIEQTPLWNSNASGGHDSSGLEPFPVSDHLGSLRNGDNILAIHGLNTSNTSSDFIISAELVAGVTGSSGGISPSAIEYTGSPITFDKSTQVKARILDGTTWSALNEAVFAIGPVAENLRVTELMYHPKNTGDPNDPNEEFIELKNIGLTTLNLNLVRFTEGIHFTFPDIELGPDEHVVVVRDISAFEAKYGTSVKMAGQYVGNLENNGERIALQNALGRTIADFEYKDGWRQITDGDGFSLTIIDPTDNAIYGSERGLFAHWKFDEGSGSTATDSAGTNNGALIGGPTWTDGRINGALSFDGVNDYVVVAPIAPLWGNTVTVEAWVRTSEFAGIWNPVMTQSLGNGYYFYISSGRPSFYIVVGAAYVQAISPDAINPNEWYHVAGTNDGANLKVYVNSQLKGSGVSTGFLGVVSNAYIGFEPASSLYYKGLIDDVRIYDRAVSETELQDIANPMRRWSREDSWRASVYRNGTPGWDDSGILPNPGSIVINEVMAHSNAGPDWIELHNTTSDPINIGGWFLSDNNRDEPNLTKYRIADGTTIPGNDYVVFYQDTDFNNPADPGCLIPFALSENGEEACISSHLDPNGFLTGYRQVEDFGASQTNVSMGRYYKSSTDSFNFVAMDYNTPDSNNAYPKVGPVVINEIMYNPPSGNQNEEYIELHNITGTLVTLYRYDKSEPWKFTDGIDYTFSTGPVVTIQAYGYLILAKDLTAFTARYGGMPPGVQVLDGYSGWLSNGGERLQIAMPGDIDELGIRHYIRIDRVNYSDGRHPEDCPGGIDYWPRGADGLGKSLSRRVSTDYGNDVANWKAAAPSPGIANP